MLEDLKKLVCQANLDLVQQGLVFKTWGNVSGVDRPAGAMVIKPSGVPYSEMKPRHMVVVSLSTGIVTEGDLRPSSDTPTHLELYRAFQAIGGVVHTHSPYATAWAQAIRSIPPFGTTHADHFRGPVPVTRVMTDEEIAADYEINTGKIIVEAMTGLDPRELPGVLVADHGPFAWGPTSELAVESAAVLEQIAYLASLTRQVEPYPGFISRELLDKHFLRKHGPGSYYGQRS
jgi:L-ribulose-5-phosphate 4-epimerase